MNTLNDKQKELFNELVESLKKPKVESIFNLSDAKRELEEEREHGKMIKELNKQFYNQMVEHLENEVNLLNKEFEGTNIVARLDKQTYENGCVSYKILLVNKNTLVEEIYISTNGESTRNYKLSCNEYSSYMYTSWNYVSQTLRYSKPTLKETLSNDQVKRRIMANI